MVPRRVLPSTARITLPRAAPCGCCVQRRRLEKGAESLLQGGGVDGVAEDAAPRAVMRHGGTWEPKELREVRRAEFGPVGQGFEAAVAGELSDHGEREQGREGGALAARGADPARAGDG